MEPFVQVRRDADTLCRTCMCLLVEGNCGDEVESGGVKHSIFDVPKLAEKLTVCTSLPFVSTDAYPKYLCNGCFGNVNEFHKFRKMCAESQKRFDELRKVHETLSFDNEKPIFDLNTDIHTELVLEETDMLASHKYPGNVKQPQISALKSLRKNTRQSRIRPMRKAAEAKTAQLVEIEASSGDRGKISAEFGVNKSAKADNVEEELSMTSISDEPSKPHINSDNDCADVNTAISIKPEEPKSVSKRVGGYSSLQCDLCPARFFVEHRLMAHKRKHEGLASYACPRENCQRTFNRFYRLTEHLKQHEGANNWYTCDHEGCGKIYKQKPTLIMHQRKFHQIGPELKSHICEICGKIFKLAAILRNHRYTHKDSSERPYPCEHPNCLRRFTKKDKLKVHMMRHAGVKNHVCPHCGMRKTTLSELKVHINYHTLERTWPCRFCKHVCNSAGNLRMHVRIVHEGAKDYACRYCDRSFAKSDTRKHHEMTHTGEKPHECEECGKRFTQPVALRTHKKIHERHRMLVESDALSGPQSKSR